MIKSGLIREYKKMAEMTISLIFLILISGNRAEWQDWALPTPTNNSAIEGFTPATATVARNRRSNYVQIFSKAFTVADSVLEGLDIAGIKSEYQFQADAAFTALRRDIEWAIMNNTTTGVSGTISVAPQMAGPFGTITTNSSAPAASTSVLTETEFITNLKKIFTKRGVFVTLDAHCDPVNVLTVMAFTGPSTTGKFLAGLGKMLFADMQTWCMAVKVPPKLKALAKTTDATTAYWKTEITLESLNESANSFMSGLASA